LYIEQCLSFNLWLDYLEIASYLDVPLSLRLTQNVSTYTIDVERKLGPYSSFHRLLYKRTEYEIFTNGQYKFKIKFDDNTKTTIGHFNSDITLKRNE
jgi:hypothetical protein